MKSVSISMRVLWAVTLLSIVSVSCTNDMDLQENNDSGKSTLLTETELIIRENIAPLHSQGLDYVYSQLNGTKGASDESIDNSLLQTNVYNLTEEFMTTSPIQEAISNYSVFFAIQTKIAYQEEDYQEYTQRITEYFDTFVNQCDDEDILESIEQYMYSETVKNLNEDDRSVLLLSLFIYEDSYNYWNNSENLEKWESFNPNAQNAQTKSWSSIWDTVKKYAKIDGAGAIGGAAGGAATGAVVGAFAGGVGAIPGAATGALGGAVGGAISASVTAALLDGENSSVESVAN